MWTKLTFRVFLPNPRDSRIRSPLDLDLIGGPPPGRGSGSGGAGAAGYGPIMVSCGPYNMGRTGNRFHTTHAYPIWGIAVHSKSAVTHSFTMPAFKGGGSIHELDRETDTWVCVPIRCSTYHSISGKATHTYKLFHAMGINSDMWDLCVLHYTERVRTAWFPIAHGRP